MSGARGTTPPGFCPYCGHTNPPTYRFCLSCRRRLPSAGLAPMPPPEGRDGAVVAPAAAEAGASVPAPGVPPVEVPPSPGRAWYFLPVAVILVILLALAGIYYLPSYLDQTAGRGPPPSGTWSRADLCTPANGSDCAGNSISLPWDNRGSMLNATACDPVPSLGSGEVLWLNYTSSQTVVGIVIPSSYYPGPGGWYEDPSGFVNNTTAKVHAVWYSGYASGSDSAAIQIPDDGQTYCLGWWEPSGSVTVQWASDLAVTFFRSG